MSSFSSNPFHYCFCSLSSITVAKVLRLPFLPNPPNGFAYNVTIQYLIGSRIQNQACKSIRHEIYFNGIGMQRIAVRFLTLSKNSAIASITLSASNVLWSLYCRLICSRCQIVFPFFCCFDLFVDVSCLQQTFLMLFGYAASYRNFSSPQTVCSRCYTKLKIEG